MDGLLHCAFSVFGRFKDLVTELKLVKEKCDHMEQSLAKDKLLIVRGFDVWWADQAARLQVRDIILYAKYYRFSAFLPFSLMLNFILQRDDSYSTVLITKQC